MIWPTDDPIGTHPGDALCGPGVADPWYPGDEDWLIGEPPMRPFPALHSCPACGRHPATHAPAGPDSDEACQCCGLGDERSDAGEEAAV